MQQIFNCAIAFIVSLAISWVVYPKILLISIRKNIVDAPNFRKLQKIPVPILGGFVVFCGILTAMLCVSSQVDVGHLFTVMCIMTVMLITGFADDLITLTASRRFFIEIFVISLLLMSNHSLVLDDFHSLWGLHGVSLWIGLPLTIVAGVGIINAINLIDGIDGLCSGYCMLACAFFAVFFYQTSQQLNLFLALAAVGGLIPFFLHNVFGRYSKMYIGDAGSLMLGFIMAYFVLAALSCDPQLYNIGGNYGMIAMLLAVLAVPVFDTLRVMFTRILKGVSPFTPDKIHLHHMFIRLGYSHIGASVTILLLNVLVVLCWYLAYRAELSADVQFYVVVVAGFMITVALYQYVEGALAKSDEENGNLPLFVSLLKSFGSIFRVRRCPFLNFMRLWMDYSVKEPERIVISGKSVEKN